MQQAKAFYFAYLQHFVVTKIYMYYFLFFFFACACRCHCHRHFWQFMRCTAVRLGKTTLLPLKAPHLPFTLDSWPAGSRRLIAGTLQH